MGRAPRSGVDPSGGQWDPGWLRRLGRPAAISFPRTTDRQKARTSRQMVLLGAGTCWLSWHGYAFRRAPRQPAARRGDRAADCDSPREQPPLLDAAAGDAELEALRVAGRTGSRWNCRDLVPGPGRCRRSGPYTSTGIVRVLAAETRPPQWLVNLSGSPPCCIRARGCSGPPPRAGFWSTACASVPRQIGPPSRDVSPLAALKQCRTGPQ